MASLPPDLSVEGAVYLLKVPKSLSSTWHNAEAGAVLGEVSVGEEIELSTAATAGNTKKYGMVKNASAELQMRAFRAKSVERETEDDNGDVQVTVDTTGIFVAAPPLASLGLVPHTGLNYRRDLRTRMLNSLTARTVQALDDDERPAVDPSKNIIRVKRPHDEDDDDDDEGGATKKKKKKGTAKKLDKAAIKAHIFKVLSDKPADEAPTFRDLQASFGDTRPPADAALKDVLDDLCNKIRRPNKLQFVLKPEYRRQAPSSSS